MALAESTNVDTLDVQALLGRCTELYYAIAGRLDPVNQRAETVVAFFVTVDEMVRRIKRDDTIDAAQVARLLGSFSRYAGAGFRDPERNLADFVIQHVLNDVSDTPLMAELMARPPASCERPVPHPKYIARLLFWADGLPEAGELAQPTRRMTVQQGTLSEEDKIAARSERFISLAKSFLATLSPTERQILNLQYVQELTRDEAVSEATHQYGTTAQQEGKMRAILKAHWPKFRAALTMKEHAGPR